MSGIVDAPSTFEENDSLGTDIFAAALVDFIATTDTPLTIGVQGEWGSGKTSLLNRIHGSLAESGNFRQIWINSWEHSLLASPETALISIVSEIISEMLGADSTAETGAKIKSIAKGIFAGAAKVGATVALGSTAGEVVGDFVDDNSESSIAKLRQELDKLSKEIRTRDTNPFDRIVVYVDDLDRIEPKNAVALLELLKNIFNVSGCIFVLAIDYQVVVKGLEHKFGPRTPENEWEFRAFFDKIIQLPFMMPMGQYDIGKYVNDLLKRISYTTEFELDSDGLQEIVSRTIGGNPRALKRLVNALSLIGIFSRKMLAQDTEGSEARRLDQDSETHKLLLFSLICLQIAFPDIYKHLVGQPDFETWDAAWAFSITLGKEEDEKSFEKSYSAVQETEDFDEDWERALYRVCFISPRYRARVDDISKLLSYIKDTILSDHKDHGQIIAEVLSETAVTSVSSTDDEQSKLSVTKVGNRTIYGDSESKYSQLISLGYTEDQIGPYRTFFDILVNATQNDDRLTLSFGKTETSFNVKDETRRTRKRGIVYIRNPNPKTAGFGFSVPELQNSEDNFYGRLLEKYGEKITKHSGDSDSGSWFHYKLADIVGEEEYIEIVTLAANHIVEFASSEQTVESGPNVHISEVSHLVLQMDPTFEFKTIDARDCLEFQGKNWPEKLTFQIVSRIREKKFFVHISAERRSGRKIADHIGEIFEFVEEQLPDIEWNVGNWRAKHDNRVYTEIDINDKARAAKIYLDLISCAFDYIDNLVADSQ